LGFYGYYGGVFVSRGAFAGCGANSFGYGGADNRGGPGESPKRLLPEGTIGLISLFWRSPNYGALQLMTQYSYLSRAPWFLVSGTPKIAHGSMVFVNLRYVLP